MESHTDDTDWADETDFLLLIAYYFFFFTTDSLLLTADLADLNRFIQISSFSDCLMESHTDDTDWADKTDFFY